MNYRQAKKFLTKAYKEAIRMQDEHFLSGSANRLVRGLKHRIECLKTYKVTCAGKRNVDYSFLV